MTQGPYDKYAVTKTDGSPVDPEAQYFVLRLDTDPFSWLAMLTYASALPVGSKLARQLCGEIYHLAKPPCPECRNAMIWCGHDAYRGYCEACDDAYGVDWQRVMLTYERK